MLEPIEPAFQSAKSDELVSQPVLLVKTMVYKLAMEFFHTRRKIVLKLEVGQHLVQQIKFELDNCVGLRRLRRYTQCSRLGLEL